MRKMRIKHNITVWLLLLTSASHTLGRLVDHNNLQPTSATSNNRDNNSLRSVASCVSNYADLVAAFTNAAGESSPSFVLCEGAISVEGTLLLEASSASLSCAGVAESCILEKGSSIVGRILRIKGNGVTISGITFKDGKSHFGGGAVLISGTDGFAPVTIESCGFVGNVADRDGGAVKITRHGCSVKIYDSRFVSNQANSYGGAVSILENNIMCRSVYSSRRLIACPLEISGSTFQSNIAGYGGGAVHSNFNVCQSGNEGSDNVGGVICDDVLLKYSDNSTCFSILSNSTEIAASVAVTPSPTPSFFPAECSTQSWPTCTETNLTGTVCQNLIESDCPSLSVYIVEYDAYVTEDYNTDRVRIYVKNDYVFRTPVVG